MPTWQEQLYLEGLGLSLDEKTDMAVKTLKLYEEIALSKSPDGYYLAFSGGKDSVVIKRLAEMSGVRFVAHYNQTTIDPPELVRFIRDIHPDVVWNKPEKPFFWTLAHRKGIPTRRIRWCCEIYKEGGGEGLVKILGVRAAESRFRADNWKVLTPWRRGGGYCVNPILFWTDEDVWGFIHKNEVPYCSLYDEGWTRLGCIGCPMAGQGRLKEFSRWPRFEVLWRRAMSVYWETHKDARNRKGEPYYVSRFSSPDELWDWWMSEGSADKELDDSCQMGLF